MKRVELQTIGASADGGFGGDGSQLRLSLGACEVVGIFGARRLQETLDERDVAIQNVDWNFLCDILADSRDVRPRVGSGDDGFDWSAWIFGVNVVENLGGVAGGNRGFEDDDSIVLAHEGGVPTAANKKNAGCEFGGGVEIRSAVVHGFSGAGGEGGAGVVGDGEFVRGESRVEVQLRDCFGQVGQAIAENVFL